MGHFQETIVEKVNLASNRDYNHGTIIRIYMEKNKVLLLLTNMETPQFLFKLKVHMK